MTVTEYGRRLLRLVRQRRIPDVQFWITEWRNQAARRPWRSYDMLSVVSKSPAILISGAPPGMLLRYFQPAAHKVPVVIFYRAGWSLEVEESLRLIAEPIREAARRFPNHRYVVLANTAKEKELVNEQGIGSEFFSENIFIDESLYQPSERVEERPYDAILDASIVPYKRHELAAEIVKLGLVSGRYDERSYKSYAESIAACLHHATWINGFPNSSGHRNFNAAEVAAAYRTAKVGLALSAVEGGCKASMQYLMAGLPVVSTTSLGGRDVFFDPSYSRIVPPSASEVAAAVKYFVDNPPDPYEIRERTMTKVWQMRRSFLDYLRKECGVECGDEKAWWASFFSDKPLSYQCVRKIAESLRPEN